MSLSLNILFLTGPMLNNLEVSELMKTLFLLWLRLITLISAPIKFWITIAVENDLLLSFSGALFWETLFSLESYIPCHEFLGHP
jgi:hypothetical protein